MDSESILLIHDNVEHCPCVGVSELKSLGWTRVNTVTVASGRSVLYSLEVITTRRYGVTVLTQAQVATLAAEGRVYASPSST